MKRKPDAYKGIPGKERDDVHLHMHMLAARIGRGRGFDCPTPQQAYADLLKVRQSEKDRKAEKEQKEKAERGRNDHEYARKKIAEAMNRLAMVRDLLDFAARGELPPSMLDEQDAAMYANAVIELEGHRLEKALVTLGLIDKSIGYFEIG